MDELSNVDIVREALVIAAEQPQNQAKSAAEMYALAVALFGEHLLDEVFDG